MILNTVTSSVAFPAEVLTIDINTPIEELDNARLGIRMNNYYYYNEKYAVNANFSVRDVQNVSLIQPTNSASIPGDFPLTWDCNIQANPTRNNQYLYLSFTGGTSGITIYPSNVYPIIKKISDNQISLSAGFLPFQYFGYDDVYDITTFRKNLTLSSVQNGQNNNLTFSFSAPPYQSRTRRNNIFSTAKNYSNVLRRVIDKNIIDNSFSITVPLVSSNKASDAENIFLVTLYNKDSNPISMNTGTISFSYLSSEDIEEATGISNGQYFTTNSLNCQTGSISLVSRAPLLFAKNEEVTVTYETSSNLTISNYSQVVSSTNFFTLSTINPIFFYNQRFSFRNTTGGITTSRDAFTISFYPSAGITATNNSIRGISSVDSRIVFTDNYYQNTFNTNNINSTKAKKDSSNAQKIYH